MSRLLAFQLLVFLYKTICRLRAEVPHGMMIIRQTGDSQIDHNLHNSRTTPHPGAGQCPRPIPCGIGNVHVVETRLPNRRSLAFPNPLGGIWGALRLPFNIRRFNENRSLNHSLYCEYFYWCTLVRTHVASDGVSQ